MQVRPSRGKRQQPCNSQLATWVVMRNARDTLGVSSRSPPPDLWIIRYFSALHFTTASPVTFLQRHASFTICSSYAQSIQREVDQLATTSLARRHHSARHGQIVALSSYADYHGKGFDLRL